MLTLTANKFSQNPLETLKQVATSDIPAHIVADGYAGVLLSEQEYRNIMATLEIYANPALHKNILDAAAESLDECVPLEDVEW